MLPLSNRRHESPKPQVAESAAKRLSDHVLVTRAAAQDERAIAEIWDRYSSLVRGVIYTTMGPDRDLEDLVQEVFIAFINNCKNLENGGALKAYLASIAVRQAAQEIRKRKIRSALWLSRGEDTSKRHLQPADVGGKQSLEALQRVLARLSERRRTAFFLRHVEGLTVLDVATAMNISESTLRRDLEAARNLVKQAAATEPALAELFDEYPEAW